MNTQAVTIIPGTRPTVTETSFGVWKVQMPGEIKDTLVYRYAGAFWKCTEHRPRQDCAHIAAVMGTLTPKESRFFPPVLGQKTISLPESALAGIVKRLADLQYLRNNPSDVLMITDELLTAIERRDWKGLGE